MTNTEFSRTLRAIITEQKVEVRALARKSGVSEEAIHSWMRGESSPRLELVGYVLQVLGYKLEVVPK